MQNSGAGTVGVKAKRTQDAEIAAMAKISKMIEAIPDVDGARRRVLDYLHSRFCLQGNL